MRQLLQCLLLCVLLHQVTCLRFIAAPLLPISPAMDIMGVAAQLQSRGHQVLVLVTQPALEFAKSAAARHSSNMTAEGLEYLVLNLTYREFKHPKPLKLGEVPEPSVFAIPDSWPHSLLFRLTSGLTMLQMFQPGVPILVQQLLGNATLMAQLHSFGADAWMSVGLSLGPSIVRDNTACIMSQALGVHMVDVSGNAFFEGPPTAPQFGTLLTPADLNTLPGMALNLATWTLYQLAAIYQDLFSLHPSPTNKLRQQYGLPWASSPCLLSEVLRRLRGVETRECRPIVEVMTASWLVEYWRTLPANTVLVGPGTARPAHPISPPSVAAFVDSAPQGVVLAAFGTVYGPTLRPEDVFELSKGFAALSPIRVLWALKPAALRPGIEMADLPIGDNTLVVPWVDYNDVLGHRHIKAFVSHCGLHSVNEAAFHGVPMVALPFQMEQAENGMKLASRGAALICKQSPAFRRGSAAARAITFTADHVGALVREVMSNESYAQAAHGIGAALQRYSAHRHAYERAADELELAVLAADARQAAAAAAAGAASPAEGAAHQQDRHEGLHAGCLPGRADLYDSEAEAEAAAAAMEEELLSRGQDEL